MNDDYASHLLHWFDRHGRHDLPWQHPRTPYRVWLSEVLLQQTQASVVIPYFLRFAAALPDITSLAAAPLDTVLALWSGLGYYARARNLHAAAKACMATHNGEIPRDFDALLALPGIGRSTAGAIMSQAWGDRLPILDGNARRVLARYHGIEGWPGLPAVEKRLWALATQHLPDARMADYTQAQMDFGATLCTRNPACAICPLQASCVAFHEGCVAGLPSPKPARPRPRRSALILLAQDCDARILLQRRPPTGVWATLWSLPQLDDDAGARLWFTHHLRGDYDAVEMLPYIDHAFSHYHLKLQPLRWRDVAMQARVADNEELRWVPREQLASLGIPAPIRTLLQEQ
ncbi:MAG: A/G-specific adenine glycosylase [Luteimonas sp.]